MPEIDPNALPAYMRQVLQDSGIPNINLDPSERITIQVAPEEAPAPVSINTQPYEQPSSPPGINYDVPDGVDPLRVAQQEGRPYQVGDQVGYDQPYVPQPQPQSSPTVMDVPASGPESIDAEIKRLSEALLNGSISRREFEIRAQELELRQKFNLEREQLRARTALEKKKIDENIAKYQANALREAEVAKALTLVAYKASRPDTELVQAFMSPMSGLSSLYKAVGPVQGANIQLPRSN
jgi:hypothetical protein